MAKARQNTFFFCNKQLRKTTDGCYLKGGESRQLPLAVCDALISIYIHKHTCINTCIHTYMHTYTHAHTHTSRFCTSRRCNEQPSLKSKPTPETLNPEKVSEGGEHK